MRRFIRMLRARRKIILVFITGLFIPVSINLLSAWLQSSFGYTANRLLQVTGLTILVVLGLFFVVVVLGKEPPVELVPEEKRPIRYPGLIVLVSRRNSERIPAHEIALRYHADETGSGGEQLRACWLIATSGEQGTVPEARRIRSLYGSKCTILIKEIHDPFAIEETFATVRLIYREAQEDENIHLTPAQIIADFTGATTPMSVGMALACKDLGPMQYIQGGKNDIASIPTLVAFTGNDA